MKARAFAVLLIVVSLIGGAGAPRLAARTAAHGDEIAVDGSRLYYEVTGDGSPLVLLHGGNLDSGMWDDDVPVLATSWRVVRYDSRPYGRSGPQTPGFSNVEDLRALLDHLKIARAHLVGLSLGGRIAIDFALQHPDRVDRLVLAGPGLTGFTWRPDPRIAPMFEAAKAGDAAKAMALWLQHPYMAPAMEQPAVAAKIRAISVRNEKIWRMPRVPETLPQPPAAARLDQIRAPTLVVIGERDVPDIHAIVGLLAKQVADVRVVRIPKAGHMVSMEAPAEFRRAVTEFLKQPR